MLRNIPFNILSGEFRFILDKTFNNWKLGAILDQNSILYLISRQLSYIGLLICSFLAFFIILVRLTVPPKKYPTLVSSTEVVNDG